MAEKAARFKVSDNISHAAVKCQKNRACLSDPDYVLCGTTVDVDDAARVLRCTEETDCRYSSKFGGRRVCTCPVRHEMAKKYGI